MRAQPEQQLQRQVAAFLAVALPPDVFWTTIPLGGGGAMRGKVLRGMGTRKGMVDMIVCQRYALTPRGYTSLNIGIELKAPKGRVSDDQKRCHAELEAAGWNVFVCRSLDDVIAALQACGVKLRAR